MATFSYGNRGNSGNKYANAKSHKADIFQGEMNKI